MSQDYLLQDRKWILRDSIIVSFSTNYFYDKNSKTINICFLGQLSTNYILRSHVATASEELNKKVIHPWQRAIWVCKRLSKPKQKARESKSTKRRRFTYSVPAMAVLIWVLSSGNNLARPKSAIFGVNDSSTRMLLNFMSLCIILNFDSSWRNARPSAVPSIILYLSSQLSGWTFFLTKANRCNQSIQNEGYKDNYQWSLA